MAVKIRLQRHGKKGKPYFYIVAADSRTKRDGRYIERFGNYNPNTNPAIIELDHDVALKWLQNGAVPTDTARAILSYKGVLYHNHLLKGVAKGAFSEEEAEKRYAQWVEEKDTRVQSKVDRLAQSSDDDRKARLAAEKEVNDARERELAAAASALTVEAEAAVEEATEVAAEAVEEAAEVVAEATEEATEVVAEVAEKAPEAVAEAVEEVTETVAEVAEEATEAVAEVAEEATEVASEGDTPADDKGEEENKEA